MEMNFHFELNKNQREQWFEFWNNCKHSYVRQHYLYGDIERAKGRIPIYATGQVNGSLVCIAIFSIRPLFFGNKLSFEAYCLRGPAFDDVSFFKDFIQLVITRFRQLHIGSIRISPYWQFPEAEQIEAFLNELGFVPYNKHEGSRSNTGYVDLQGSENDILDSFSKKTRKEIRKAEKLGVEIRPVVDIDEAMVAFRCLCAMRATRGLIPMSPGEFKAAFRYILKDKEHGILFNAFLGTAFLGARWLMKGRNTASGMGYAIDTNTCNKLAKTLTIGYSLWWQGIKWAKEKGCLWYDVEGYREGAEKSDSLYHIYKFKGKFRPKPVQIISQHVYICNNAIYNIYKGYNFFLRGCRFIKSLPYQVKTRHFFNRRSAPF